MSRAKEEAEGMEKYDYLIINDDLMECVEEMHQIIQGAVSYTHLINVANTAIAAKKVVEDQDPSQAAVCSVYAAKVHGLQAVSYTHLDVYKRQKEMFPGKNFAKRL